MTHRHRPLRAAALLAAAALTLTACSGGDDPVETSNDTGSSEPTASSNGSPTGAPVDDEVTPPGTQLAFGDPATVAYEDKSRSTLLKIRVESAEQGSLDDFEGFDLDDPYKKRGNYYYVRVTLKNGGKKAGGGIPVPLWGISGDNTLLQAVEFKSSFAKCPTEPLPKKFKPQDTFTTCLVYLSPNKGDLQGVSYRPTEQYEPIEWRGQVKMLPKPKDDDKDDKDDEKGSGDDR